MKTALLVTLALALGGNPRPPIPGKKIPKPELPKKLTPERLKEMAADAAPTPPADPEVTAAVARMQKFYENTKDFTARFRQTYLYKSLNHTTEAEGRVRFLKEGGQMRWDYLDKAGVEQRIFVITGNRVYAFDREAKQLTISGIDTDKLSASVTFLMGKGKLEREFDIRRAKREDLTGGLALELTPKKPDGRFDRIYFVVDPVTSAVMTSVVVDPDGSENRIDFKELKANGGIDPKVFRIDPPAGTQILDLDGVTKPSKP